VPSVSEGWTAWAWKEKKYLVANTTDARISFHVTVRQNPGTINLVYQRSAVYGLGTAQCWLEELKATTMKKLPGYWKLTYNILQ
jgi:hypothetical protein